MDEIVENGAVISPYPLGTRPRKEFFPLRNRLLSAWVNQLLVVEAGARSGALVTAGYAIEQKRKVFAVPNSIYVSESSGTNRLIQAGAEIYLEPKQLVNLINESFELEYKDITSLDLPIKPNSSKKKIEKKMPISSPQEQNILDRLSFNGSNKHLEIRDLLDLFDGNLNALLSLLCIMELEGKVMISGQTVRSNSL